MDVQLIITLFGVDGSRLIHARQTVKSHPLRTVADLVTSIPSLECIQSHAPAGFNVTKVLVFDNERDQFVDAHLDELVFQDATYQFDIQATAQVGRAFYLLAKTSLGIWQWKQRSRSSPDSEAQEFWVRRCCCSAA